MNAFDTALGWWVVSVVVLFFKMHAVSFVQLRHRMKARTFRTPEDVAVFGGKKTTLAPDTDLGERAGNVWRNDLENIPIYCAVSLAFVLLGGSATAGAIYFGLYTLARVSHTLCYLAGKQPHRFISHVTALTTCGVMALHCLVTLFG